MSGDDDARPGAIMTTKTALLATLVLAAAACQKEGGSSNPPTTGGDVTDPSASDDGGAADDAGAAADGGDMELTWAEMDFKQRKEFMGVEVLPKMKASFKEYDEAQYKGFGCDTCHGEDGKDKNYAMPSDSIYPLPEADPVKAAMEYDEAVTKFMVETVVPDMATLLNEEPYNPDTGEGSVGCFTCHPKE